ncbi:MAG: nuclear transport factor 2 family protein [Gammaproteobacteria bacterium]|nr:nuclear transport factor 2 family protein [Gammaproteobacteria bacterium]
MATLRCYGIAFALALGLISANARAHDDVESACRSLVIDYAYYRDRLDADNYAAVFAKDAVLSVLGNEYSGRETIRQRLVNLLETEGKPISRHMMSTIKIIPIDANAAHGVSYVKVYVEPPNDERPVATNGYVSVGEYHDIFTRTDDGWKIARREYKPILEPASE